MWLTIASPRPVPRFLVEKYGRNSFSLSSGLTPQPESATTSSTVSAAPGCVATYSFFTSESCMASAALSTRFTTTRWNCSRSRFTGGSPGAKLVWMAMPSSRSLKTARASCTTSLRSLRTGCAAGKRANCENSSTSVFTESTDFEMVSAHSRMMRAGRLREDPGGPSGGRCVRPKARWE